MPHRHIQRASRELFAVVRGSTETHAHLRNRLLAILWITVVLVIVSTVLVYLFERHAANSQITTPFEAFLFSTGQLLTASSVTSPTTEAGKILELFFDVYALTVVAALAGSFGAFFHKRSEEIRKKHEQEAAAAARAV
jgi:FtsH-binding integral membrane protein